MADTQLDLRKYLQLITANKRLFAVVALAVMTAAVLASYVIPKKYEAKATVFIEQNVITDLVKGIAVTPSMEAKVKVLTVAMLSRTMLQKVIKKLDKDVGLKGEAAQEALIKSLQRATEINLDEKRGVFEISFRDSNPVFARDYVNTLTQTYIEQNTSSKREESLEATKFLSDQIDTFKRRIDMAEEEINKFKVEKGMILTVDDNVIRHEIEGSEKKLDDLRARLVELETQERLLRNGVESQELADLRRQRDAMKAVYTEDHPRLIRIRKQIAELRKAAKDPGSAPVGSAKYEMLQVETKSVQDQIAKEEQNIEDNKKMLREMPAIKSELAELERKKDNESIIYNQLVSRYGQSEVSKQMEIEDKSMTFRIIDAAILPEFPVSPNRILIILGGIVAGLGAAVGLLILRDMFKHSVKSLDEVRTLGIPIFGTIPLMSNPAEEALRRRADRKLYAYSAGYFSMILAVLVVEIVRRTPAGASIGNMLHKFF